MREGARFFFVRKLGDAEAKLAAGSSVPEVARDLSISEASFYRWRKKYSGMSSSEAKRLKELEKESARLKKLVAEQALTGTSGAAATMLPPSHRIPLRPSQRH